MKKIYLTALSVFMYCAINAQNLYVVNYVNFDSQFFIKELNAQTGATLYTQGLTSFTNNYGPVSLDYLPATSEIIGRIAYYTDNSLWKYNVQTKTETLLPVALSTPLNEVIVANNRVFAVSDKQAEGIAPSIHEINGSTGNIISSHNFNYGGDYSPVSLSFMPSTNTIFGVIPWGTSSRLVKYNIGTNVESVLTLSATDMDYNYLIVAENRLFVAQRVSTGNDNTHDFFLKEINPDTGAILSTFELNFESSDNLQSFTFIPATHEIVGRIPFNDDEKLLKFNILTNTQSIVTLSPEVEGFGDIIYVNNTTAGLPNFNSKTNKGKVIRAYNFLGQQINIDTFNQPMILEYENGFREKVIQLQK